MRVAGIRFRFWQRTAVHLFPDGLLDNSAAHFHEVALWA